MKREQELSDNSLFWMAFVMLLLAMVVSILTVIEMRKSEDRIDEKLEFYNIRLEDLNTWE